MKSTSLDIETALRFSFQDPKWVEKYAVAALLTLTGIGMVPVVGWILEMTHALITKGKTELPAWDRLGDFAVSGLKYLGVTLLVSLPVYALLMPLFFLSFITDVNEEAMLLLFVVLQMLILGCSFLFGLVSPVLVGRYAETLSFRETLQPRELWRVYRANWLQFAGAALLGMIVSTVASLAGLLLLCIGVWFTTTIGMVITFHLYGQAYRNARLTLS